MFNISGCVIAIFILHENILTNNKWIISHVGKKAVNWDGNKGGESAYHMKDGILYVGFELSVHSEYCCALHLKSTVLL